MEVYLMNVKSLLEDAAYQRLSAYVPAERRERIARYRSASDRARGLGAGILLEYGLRARGLTLLADVPGCKSVALAQGAYGKPYLADETNVCFNLSHAGDYAAAVFAGSAVGIDIEQIRKARVNLAERFFTEAEAVYLGQIPDGEARDQAFTRIWTRKESYIKAAGEGMHLPLADFCVLEDLVRYPKTEDAGYVLRTMEPAEGYLLSVCVASDRAGELEQAVVKLVEPGGEEL